MSTTTPDATSAGAPAAAGPMGAGLSGGNGPNGGTAARATAAGRPSPAVRVPRERKAMLACVVAIIVYLVLSYLVFVRPGVSRSEHLLAVLLPAAILALSADLWPRLQAGLRASLALLYGAFALVTGLVSVSRLRVEGVSAAGLAGLLPSGGRRRADRAGTLAALGLAQTRWSTLVDARAPRPDPDRGAVRGLLGGPAGQHGHHRHRAPEPAGQGRGSRAPLREGHADHA